MLPLLYLSEGDIPGEVPDDPDKQPVQFEAVAEAKVAYGAADQVFDVGQFLMAGAVVSRFIGRFFQGRPFEFVEFARYPAEIDEAEHGTPP